MRTDLAPIGRPAEGAAGRIVRRLAGAVAAGLLAACSGPPAGGESYFPLERGHRWVYDSASEWENNTVEREQIVLSTHGEESLESGGRAWRRRSASGVDYWLRADDTGIFRVASKTDLEAEPAPDKAPRYVLKQPLAVGTQWQATTTAYLLRRRAEFPPEIRHTHQPVMMQYRIEALGEKVATRAGAFTDCIRVKGDAAMRLFADPVNGFKDMPLTTLEWYCKGVGLVKLERREPAQSTFLSGGTLTMELTEWQ
ncbi:hypothetical protein [Ideonella sp. A 288]|uniref:hypothetical protein n=1 Tax=Ideonella sp. A 288 TaxID=1962181 RepID=UPI001F351D00|nr:hypothetical protein [Ideonella sp. A 288]